jgi:hypothetical protein
MRRLKFERVACCLDYSDFSPLVPRLIAIGLKLPHLTLRNVSRNILGAKWPKSGSKRTLGFVKGSRGLIIFDRFKVARQSAKSACYVRDNKLSTNTRLERHQPKEARMVGSAKFCKAKEVKEALGGGIAESTLYGMARRREIP